jgi:hypothetical protein
MNPSGMRCQYCGGTVVLRSADGIYHDNSRNTKLYVCSKLSAVRRLCPHASGHHDSRRYAGQIMSFAPLRKRAHHYFDQLYSSGR